jgi:hypothetical protein
MRLKHLKRIGLIVAWVALGLPSHSLASKAGVILERAQVSLLGDSGLVQAELTLNNQLSSEVDAVELELACVGTTEGLQWSSAGRRTIGLAAGAKVSVFFSVRGPGFVPSQCSAKLLGYHLNVMTASLMKMLLATGFSADERAALVGAGESKGLLNQELEKPSPEVPGVEAVLVKLLGWYANALEPAGGSWGNEKADDLARFDQPLQVVLSARERGTNYSSPIAFVLPSGASTMKQVLDGFRKKSPKRIELLKEFSTQSPAPEKSPESVEPASFYKKLSFGLILGIILWTLWNWRRRSRKGVSSDV